MTSDSRRTARVQVPCYINLVGDHLDYSHLPVIAMAIDRYLVLDVAPTDVPEIRFQRDGLSGEASVSRADFRVKGEHWGATLSGVARVLAGAAPGQGADIAISGWDAASEGLGAASALTLGSVAALNRAWGLGLSASEMASLARDAGSGAYRPLVAPLAMTAGGVSRLDRGTGETAAIAWPDGVAIVVAKSAGGFDEARFRAAMAERVLGARLATAMLCDMIGVDAETPPRLGDLTELPEADILVEDLPDRTSPNAVASSTGILAESLAELESGGMNPREDVHVKKYARHILAEKDRVAAFEAALGAADLRAIGLLAHQGHESLKAFGCSTPALDALCAAMKKAGAAGAKLTGYGFGGYAVAFVAPDRVAEVIAAAEAAGGSPAFVVKPGEAIRVEAGS